MISQLNLKREINFSEYPLLYFKADGVKAKRREQKHEDSCKNYPVGIGRTPCFLFLLLNVNNVTTKKP